MAEEPVLAPDVRTLVELPGARHRTHGPAGHHGRQSRRVAGLTAGSAQRDGPDRRDPQARQGHRDRPGAHPDRRARRRVASHRARDRRGAVAGGRAHPLRRRPRPSLSAPRRPPRWAGHPAAGRRGLATGTRRRRHRHRRRPDPPAGPRTRRHRQIGGLRTNRVVQPGIRQPRQLARRRGQHPDRSFRHPRRRHVPQAGRLVDHHAAPARIGGRRTGIRPLAHPRARRQGSSRPGAGVVHGRRDRHPGRRPTQGAHHGRGQPGAVHPRRRQARRSAADAGGDDLR